MNGVPWPVWAAAAAALLAVGFAAARHRRPAGAALSSAYGSSSVIIHVPEPTSFSLTYNSNVADRSGAATVSVIRLTRKE